MKICIIGYSARRISPYLQFYIDYLQKKNIDFDFITREIDKEYLDTNILENQYVIDCSGKRSKLGKIIETVGWINKVKSIIGKNKYDKLILLTGYPAILLSNFITRNYPSKYIVDIRDYMPLFDNPIFLYRLKNTLNKSGFNIISSDGFREWMPTLDRVYTIHNCPDKKVENNGFTILKNKVLTIGYLGVISYIENNLRLIDYFSEETTYRLYFAGVYDKEKRLQRFVNDNGITNVSFDGEFDNRNKDEIYSKVDMINAIYGNDSLTVTSALPNKLYDAILYRKPIIVSKGTFLASIVEKYDLGLAIDLDKSPVEEINSYVKNFDGSLFINGAEKLLQKCRADNEYIQKKLDVFVRTECRN